MPVGRDQFGPTDPGGYSCPVCGIGDPHAYMRCNDPRCLDGRDRPCLTYPPAPWRAPIGCMSFLAGVAVTFLILAALNWIG